MNGNGYQMLKEGGGGGNKNEGKKTKQKTKGGSTKNVA